jgi:hypothetical protein
LPLASPICRFPDHCAKLPRISGLFIDKRLIDAVHELLVRFCLHQLVQYHFGNVRRAKIAHGLPDGPDAFYLLLVEQQFLSPRA